MKEKWKWALPVILMIVLAISMWPGMSEPLARLFHLSSGQNFSAAYALAFCAGVYFPGRMRWTLPLGMFILVNILTNLHYGVSPFNRYIFVKVAAFALLIWIGTHYSAKNSTFKLIRGGLLGSLLFYIVTNTASWMWDPVYAKSLAGWLQALTLGTPGYPPTILFLLNSLLSGGLFTGLFVGAMKLTASAESPVEKEAGAREADSADEDPGMLPAPEKSEA